MPNTPQTGWKAYAGWQDRRAADSRTAQMKVSARGLPAPGHLISRVPRKTVCIGPGRCAHLSSVVASARGGTWRDEDAESVRLDEAWTNDPLSVRLLRWPAQQTTHVKHSARQMEHQPARRTRRHGGYWWLSLQGGASRHLLGRRRHAAVDLTKGSSRQRLVIEALHLIRRYHLHRGLRIRHCGGPARSASQHASIVAQTARENGSRTQVVDTGAHGVANASHRAWRLGTRARAPRLRSPA